METGQTHRLTCACADCLAQRRVRGWRTWCPLVLDVLDVVSWGTVATLVVWIGWELAGRP